MQGRFAFRTPKIGVHGDARNPGEPVAGENQRPRIAVLARHSRVDQDVLQLARASAARGAHAQPGAPESEPDSQVGLQVSRIRIVAAIAVLYLQTRSIAALCGRVDLHEVAHDTKTPPAG